MSEDGSKSIEDLQSPWSLVLVGVAGSKAYGLDHEGSDTDYHGVFQIDTSALLGLDKTIETVTNTGRADKESAADYTYQELGKFCRLALAGNPTILEMLWLPEYTVKTEVGTTLVGLRQEFLSDRVRDAFGGYARQQLERLKRNGTSPSRGEKYIRHMFRLLAEGQHLISTGELKVRVDDPEGLFALGRLPFDDVVAEFDKRDATFRATKSILPPQPNKELVNGFLIDARLKLCPPDPILTEQIENAKEAIRLMKRTMGFPGRSLG